MKKKDYIFNMTNLILNRVRFHAPISSEPIDFDRLLSYGIDLTKPVFYFKKPLSKTLAKCFERALKEEDFNLVMPREAEIKHDLPVIICNDRELEKININYPSGLKFDLKERENYIKFDGKKVEGSFNGCFLESFGAENDICFFSRQFMLNGRNFVFEITNLSSELKQTSLEISIMLARGYYSFQKQLKAIKITNLFTFERQYFNFSSYQNLFSFSCVDGAENSTFARIYLKAKISLKPKQRKYFFFNYGKEKICFLNKDDIEKFSYLAYQKNSEIFNLQIDSVDKKKEGLLNSVLPEKIIRSWLNGERDKKSEIEYSKLKEEVILNSKNQFVLNNLEGINFLKIFDGKSFVKVPIIKSYENSGRQFIMLNSTKYYGIKKFSVKDLSKKVVQICI